MRAGTKILFGNWLIVMLFIALIMFGFVSFRQLNVDTHKIINNHLIIKNITEMQSLIADSDSRKKEFLITGKDELLLPYKAAEEMFISKIKLIEEELEVRLRHEKNPEVSRRLKQIGKLIRQWNETSAKEIEIKQKIKALIDSGTERNVMEELEKELDDFIDTEMMNLKKMMDTNEPVKPIHPMLLKKIIEIRLLLADLKNGVNRFLFTDNSADVLSYSQAREKISNQINEIKDLLANDNPKQLQYIQKINALFENWYEAVASKTEVHKELETLIDTGPGREIMNSLDNEFEAFIAYRDKIFAEQRENHMKKDTDMIRILGTISGVAVMLALLISFILARSISKSLPNGKSSYLAGYEIKTGDEVHQVADAINDSVGELTKIAVLLQEVSDALKKKPQKWELGD